MFTDRQLSLILGSLRMRLAVLRDLYSRRGLDMPEAKVLPAVVAELEELITEIEVNLCKYS